MESVLTHRHIGARGCREGRVGPEWSPQRGCQEGSGGVQHRPKVTRTSSPGSRSESPDRRGEQAGTLPLAFADLYPPTAANGGAGPGSMNPEIGLPIPALSPGQPGREGWWWCRSGTLPGASPPTHRPCHSPQPAGDSCACHAASTTEERGQ